MSKMLSRIDRIIRIRRWYCSSSSRWKDELDLSRPDVQRYLEHIRVNAYTDESVPERLRPLSQLLQRRFQLLDAMKTLDELKKEMGDDAVKKEREEYAINLRVVDDAVRETLLPSSAHFGGESSCVLEVIAGVGGQEAMLFAARLLRMYQMYAAFKGWKMESTGESASEATEGLRHASAFVSGPGARELLSIEAGVHRVQRVPATEKSGRVHTSTASVAVAEPPSDLHIDIPERDIRIERKRSSGAGGQSVNTTDSCVRIYHLPTGIIVESQAERDQHRNKRTAMARLRGILLDRQLTQRRQNEKDHKKSQVGAGTRNEKIRTYNFNQDRVTDHRLGGSAGTVHDLNGVLDGGPPLDHLINRILLDQNGKLLMKQIEAFV